MSDVQKIKCCQIIADWEWNSRKGITAESVGALAQSIKDNGQDTPVVVRPDGREHLYRLVSGFRRFKAISEVLSELEIDCFVREMNDYEAKLANFRENGEREQLTFWEEILFVRDTFPEEVSIAQIQKDLNKTYDWVRPRRQIWSMPKIFVDLTEKGVYSATNINELLKRDPAQQQAAAKQATAAHARGENPRRIRKGSLKRRHVQGRKNMSRMMNIVEENSLCSDPRLNDLLLWAMGDIDKSELAARLKVDSELFLAIEE